MATVVREREQIQATNGRVQERYVDGTMTRAAREARIALRLENLAAWRYDLESLAHFDPDYPYDVAHEYDYDWTTDPDYGAEGVHFSEFEEDGALIDSDSRPSGLQLYMLQTTRDRIGDRALTKAYYVFVPQRVEHLELSTRQGSPVDRIRPDLLVMPTEADVREAYDREPGRTAQLDDAVPELVLEVLSKSTATWDLVDKQRLYEALGVHEYLVYDLGGKRGPNSSRELLMYRLADGAYGEVEFLRKGSASDPEVFWSDVFGTHIRFLPDPQENAEEFRRLPEGHRPPPRFQWWDERQERWRDRQTDAEHEQNRIVQERDRFMQERDQATQERNQATQERNQATQERDRLVDLFHQLLPAQLDADLRARIITRWQKDGPPTDAVARILAVREVPDAWRTLLLPDESDDAQGPDRLTPPREPFSP